MFAEYGARVRIDGIVDIPDGTRGVITSDTPLFGHAPNWEITLDNGQRITMRVEEFDVTMSPSETAYRLTCKWSVDECLEALVNIFSIGAQDRKLERYQSALIFELYRLNAHAEKTLYGLSYLLGDDGSDGPSHAHDGQCDVGYCPELDGGWESGTCDDGYGYPVYRVED